MLRDLVLRNRSYRRFHEDAIVSEETLRSLIDLARYCPSAANRQPLRYLLSCDAARNALIFPVLSWAKYLQGWNGPAAGERPAAYIVMLGDTRLTATFDTDLGIAAQTIMLGAAEQGLGGCMIHSIDRDRLRKALEIPVVYEILLVLALGKPKETVVLEQVKEDGSIRYWRDTDGVHHVPKRPLEELIIG